LLKAEALRLGDRYLNEAVLAFGLCPWAEPSLRAGKVGRHVLTQAAPAPTACLPVIDAWAAEPSPAPVVASAIATAPTSAPLAVEVGLLILPCYAGGRASFDAFAERVRRADRARLPAGAAPVFMLAAFHPDGADRFVGPHQLVSFLRRSPDPLLQFVRADLLDRVKTAQPTVSDGIAERNHAALVGAEALRFDGIVRAIRADRDASYARLGLAPRVA